MRNSSEIDVIFCLTTNTSGHYPVILVEKYFRRKMLQFDDFQQNLECKQKTCNTVPRLNLPYWEGI